MVRTAANGKIGFMVGQGGGGAADEPGGGGVDTALKRRMATGTPAILTPTPVPNASPNAAWRFAVASLYRLGT